VLDFYIDLREELTSVASSMRELDDLKALGKSQKTTVQCTTLDAFCEEHGLKPRILKIDVESFEPQVIAGGKTTIETLRPLILFEFWETWWTLGFRELFEYLLPMYKLIRMQDGIDVEHWYFENQGTIAADILCLPR
jgi:hypothetical protein